jgi:hypothetical protein
MTTTTKTVAKTTVAKTTVAKTTKTTITKAALKKITAEKRALGKTASKANGKKMALAMKKAGKGIFVFLTCRGLASPKCGRASQRRQTRDMLVCSTFLLGGVLIIRISFGFGLLQSFISESATGNGQGAGTRESYNSFTSVELQE